MKRFCLLAVLLCAFALIVPLTDSLSASDAECPAYPSCADETNCNPGEECYKEKGQSCGICLA